MFHGGGGHHGGGGGGHHGGGGGSWRGGGGFRRGGVWGGYLPVVYDYLDDDDDSFEVVEVGCDTHDTETHNDPNMSGEVVVMRKRRKAYGLVG